MRGRHAKPRADAQSDERIGRWLRTGEAVTSPCRPPKRRPQRARRSRRRPSASSPSTPCAKPAIGHVGLPLGCAEIGALLFSEFLKHDPARPELARPRPLRALGGPRLDAALLAAAPVAATPCSLEEIRRFRQLGSQHARASRARPHARRRDHDRAARPGRRQRGGHGARRAAARRALRQRARRPPHLRARQRRRHDGGRRLARRRRSRATSGSAS